MSTNLKQQLLDFCNTFTKERIERIQRNIADNRASLTSETKSSAGDKHETGRAMLQLEREKLGQQLSEAEKMKLTLQMIDTGRSNDQIGTGNLVYTSKNNYFLGISAGEFKNDEVSAYCISAATPIAQLLLGKTKGEEVYFRGEAIKILKID